jgi:NAD(P)-dependent dehydrogenase (short-subunit alcohol dehydrogenase family)
MTPDFLDFRDKVVLVTGAGVGIGYGLCAAFAGAGAHVVLNDHDASVARGAAESINASLRAERVAARPLDISDPGALREMGRWITEHYGRLDVAVANAGVTNYGAFLEYTPEAFDRVTAVNLRGTYFTAQAAARIMIERQVPEGRIILMSSITGTHAMTNLGAYGMTKAAVRHLARSTALELGPYGITVNAVCPGAILTERTLADDPDHEANWSAVNPNGRDGYVDDVVAAVFYLASGAARHVTGQTLVVDGGWTVRGVVPPGQPQASPELP